MTTTPDCPLCTEDGGELIWRSDFARAVLIDDADHPGFVRVIVNAHVRELTDLSDGARQQLMALVFAAEAALRTVLQPDKINLASLGNQVPHLHWHVLARFANDAHFPDPIWASRRRATDAETVAQRRSLLPALHAALIAQLDAAAGR